MRHQPRKPNFERQRRPDRAFTVVELLVAVTIMTVIILALYGMFNQTQKALRANFTQTDVLESGRAAMEMMVRELDQLGASRLSSGTNLYSGLVQGTSPVLQSWTVPNPATGAEITVTRTNFLHEYFFLRPETNAWIGTGYRVMQAGNGVGTLYRFSISTNYRSLSSNNLVNAFIVEPLTNPVTREISTNFARITGGVIHLRLTAYDPDGRRMGYYPRMFYNATNDHPAYRFLRRSSSGIEQRQASTASYEGGGPFPEVILQEDRVNTETRYFFLSNALPAFVELEFAVLDPPTLRKYEALREGPPQIAREFLRNQAGNVHLFRHRIPIRTSSSR